MHTLSEKAQALLQKPNNAIVGVNRTTGGPQLTPVWYAWDGEAFYFTTTRDRAKYSAIKRNPSITLIVDDFEQHAYVAAYGRAEIIEHDFADLLRPIIQKYFPPESVEQRVQAIMNDPARILVVLHPEHFVTL